MFTFNRFACIDDTTTIERDGFALTAKLVHDDTMGAPWREPTGGASFGLPPGRSKTTPTRTAHH